MKQKYYKYWVFFTSSMSGESKANHRVLRGHMAGVTSIDCHGARIVSGSWDRTVRVWDAHTGAELKTLGGYTQKVWSVSLNGTRVVSGSTDIRVWNLESGALLNTIDQHPDSNHRVSSVSYHGARIVSGSTDSTVRVWEEMEGVWQCVLLEGHASWVTSVSFSPDGLRIASGSWDNTVRVWEEMEGVWQCVRTLEGHAADVDSVAWDSTGARIVSGSFDRTVRVWNAHSGALLNTLVGHDRTTGSVSFSPDGKRVVSGSTDNTVRVWDVKSGQCVLILRGHTSWVNAVAWEGKYIVSGSRDKTIRIWDVGVINDWDVLREDLARLRESAKTLPTKGWDVVKLEYTTFMMEELRARADALGYTLVGYAALLEWCKSGRAALAGQDPVPPPTKQKTQLRL